ncbi:MAG TPA: SRPBCC family protein [Chitinophaga sp.]
MKTLKELLLGSSHTETIRAFVKAPPEQVWEILRHIDIATIPWIHMLFNLSTARGIFHSQRQAAQGHQSLGMDQVSSHNKGLMMLHVRPGKEVVLGAIGKFWQPDIPLADIPTTAFRDFDEPGWGKVAWAFSVEPYLQGSTVSIELRVTGTDYNSWQKLQRCYTLMGPFAYQIRSTVIKLLQHELGKPDLPDDSTRALAGDGIIPGAGYSDTDQIDIEAPPRIVWRYLMQLGYDRAGWYSVDMLDSEGMASTDHLVASWGDRKPGDRLSATTMQDDLFEVYQVQVEKHFVIGGEEPGTNGIFKMTWAYILEPIGEYATHVIVRTRMNASPKWAEQVMGNIAYPPVHGLIKAVQLSTIKRYAENTAS